MLPLLHDPFIIIHPSCTSSALRIWAQVYISARWAKMEVLFGALAPFAHCPQILEYHHSHISLPASYPPHPPCKPSSSNLHLRPHQLVSLCSSAVYIKQNPPLYSVLAIYQAHPPSPLSNHLFTSHLIWRTSQPPTSAVSHLIWRTSPPTTQPSSPLSTPSSSPSRPLS